MKFKIHISQLIAKTMNLVRFIIQNQIRHLTGHNQI